MSSNNYIRISKEGKSFVVYDKDSDTGKGIIIGKSESFKMAREIARDYSMLNIVEYGVHIDEDCFE